MKVEIVMDPVSNSGILKITPETSIDAYALYHWFRNFNTGDRGSILAVDYNSPLPLPQGGEVRP